MIEEVGWKLAFVVCLGQVQVCLERRPGLLFFQVYFMSVMNVKFNISTMILLCLF